LALLGLLVVFLLPPVPPLQQHPERQVRSDLLKTVFADSNVLILSLGIFFLHMTMTALFVALPVILVARGFVAAELGSIYAPVMILAFLGMAPMMMAAEKRSAHIRYLRFAASFIFVALLAIGLVPSGAATAMSLLLFFVGFNFIEATLPSLLSRKVDPSRRGTAMGVFATAQFLGAALGGIAGGLLFVDQNIGLIVALGIGAQLIWIVLLTVVKPVIKADAKTA
jgi:predicted MFS family arabinose efflux permease